MARNDINDYVDTMKPILYLLKLTSVLPFPSSKKDGIPKFLASRVVWFITMVAFVFLMFISQKFIQQELSNLCDNMNLKQFVVTMIHVLGRLSIFSAPLCTWNRTKQLAAYWSKWKRFQNAYEAISGNVYVSRVKNLAKLLTLASLTWALWTSVIGLIYVHKGSTDLTYFTESVMLWTVYFKGTYWLLNGMYLRSVAEEVVNLGQKIINEGKDAKKLRQISLLWLELCDLDRDFYAAHTFMFLLFFINVCTVFVFFAFMSLNNSIFGDVFNRWIQFTGVVACSFLFLVICEMPHLICEQISQRTKGMLLQRNTMKLDKEMLHSILYFSQVTCVKKPEINLNGFVILNRSLFPTIWASTINYLIILRQFSSTQTKSFRSL